MSDAHGSKNDGDEPVEEQSAPVSDDSSAPEQAPAADDTAAPEVGGSEGAAAETTGGSADAASSSAPADDAPTPDITRSGPEPRTTEFGANGADGVDDVGPSSVSADRRGDDTGDDTSAEEPDYEALAAELDRLEADTAAAAPVA